MKPGSPVNVTKDRKKYSLGLKQVSKQLAYKYMLLKIKTKLYCKMYWYPMYYLLMIIKLFRLLSLYIIMLVYKKNINKTGSLFQGLGALRHFLSLSLSVHFLLVQSACILLLDFVARFRPRMWVGFRLACALEESLPLQFFSVIFAPTPLPCSFSLFLFFSCDRNIDGVEQLPALPLDLRLILSARLSHRRRVSSMLSVVGRRRFPQFFAWTTGRIRADRLCP